MSGTDHSARDKSELGVGRLFDAGESEMRALLEFAPIGIALVRDRKIARVNESICTLFGYTREELVGASTRIVYINEEEYERMGREMRALEKNPTRKAAPVEFVGRHKNGHAIDAITQVTFLDPAKPQAGAVCMVTDISDHVRTERALQERNRQLATLTSNLPGMAYRCANDESWTMELVSPGCFALTGYTSDEIVGNRSVSFADLIVEEDRDAVWSAVQAALARREPYQLNYRIRTKERQVCCVWEQGAGVFNSSGQLEALEGLILDVTHQKQAEVNLRASEENYRSIVTHSVAGIFQIDASGRYRSVNPALAEMHGYASPEEMIAQVTSVATQIYANPEDRPLMLAKLDAEGRVQNVELEVKRKNGEPFWILLNAAVIRDENGKIAFIEGTNVDITERKRAEVLRKAKAEAEAASRAKSAFLTHMSHELRTPMNAMLGFCQLLLRDQTLSAKQRDYLVTIDRNGQHLLGIIGDILEMAKIEANRVTFAFKQFSLPALLQDLESTFRARAELKKLEFSFSVEADAPKELWADRVKVRQILINLIGNAFKFTQQGSVKVYVRSATVAEDRDHVYIEVVDTGPGIASQDLERLFEPFEQTAASAALGGTGLGLPISREYAQKMQGNLTVRSAVGKGSVFRLALPLPIEEAPMLPEKIQSAATAPLAFQAGSRVLVADDFEDNRRLLHGLLADVGCSVREVDNGLSAVDAQSQWKPHCILMDARMPGIDGLEAIRRIRKTDMSGVKILVLSAVAGETQRDEALAAGADDFLPKPFRSDELLAKLHAWLDHGRNGNGNSSQREVRVGALPADWVLAMKQALTEADLEKVSGLLENLGRTDPMLAAEFSKMAERFDFEAVRRSLEAL
jgi:PAS domain S-box-containing protein